MNKLHSVLESFSVKKDGKFFHPNPTLKIITSWCWTGMISGEKTKGQISAWLTPLGEKTRDLFRNISGEVVIPDIKAKYHERKIAKLFPAAINRIAGIHWYGEFWPQGVQIIGEYSDYNIEKEISVWTINAHGWSENECENIDGYMGNWYRVAVFDHFPSKDEISTVINMLNSL